MLKMVLCQGLTMTCIGRVIGIGLALVLGRFTANLLYDVNGTDLTTCAIVCAVLALTSMVATIVPAVRAAGIEPSKALRHERPDRRSGFEPSPFGVHAELYQCPCCALKRRAFMRFPQIFISHQRRV